MDSDCITENIKIEDTQSLTDVSDNGIPHMNTRNSLLIEYNIEILNTMTASHINLRKERDIMASKVENLSERNKKLEDELAELKNQHNQQIAEIEGHRNGRDNVNYWKKCVSDLNQQIDRKKSILRLVNKRLITLKREKLRAVEQLAGTANQMRSIYEDRDRTRNELNKLVQANANLLHEKNDMKNIIFDKEDEIKTLRGMLSRKDAELADAKNKEIQIKRIAKKYKDSYNELRDASDHQRQQNTGDGCYTEGTALNKKSRFNDAPKDDSSANTFMQVMGFSSSGSEEYINTEDHNIIV